MLIFDGSTTPVTEITPGSAFKYEDHTYFRIQWNPHKFMMLHKGSKGTARTTAPEHVYAVDIATGGMRDFPPTCAVLAVEGSFDIKKIIDT